MSDKKTKEKRQEEISRKVADTNNALLNAHLEEIVHSVKKTGDYIVTVAFEAADGMYVMQNGGDLEWETPEAFGAMHIEVIIQDRDDKRFVPHLDVSVQIYDNEHTLITQSQAPFMWHPYVFHYGLDTTLPDSGKYYAEVSIKAPAFPRHNRNHGKKYTDEVTVRMSTVDLILPGSNELDADVDNK